MGASPEVEVRPATPDDVGYAVAAAELIALLAPGNDLALRSVDFLKSKIEAGQAVVALEGTRLVGFGYWAAWQDGEFISHSGLVVHPDMQGRKLGRALKTALAESSRRRFPSAKTLSLTTSPQVKRLNLSLGFRVVPLDQLTTDPEFWRGCETCRQFQEIQARGEKCCCEGMLLEPDAQPPS